MPTAAHYGVHCTAHSGSSRVLIVAPDMRAHVAVAPASLSPRHSEPLVALPAGALRMVRTEVNIHTCHGPRPAGPSCK